MRGILAINGLGPWLLGSVLAHGLLLAGIAGSGKPQGSGGAVASTTLRLVMSAPAEGAVETEPRATTPPGIARSNASASSVADAQSIAAAADQARKSPVDSPRGQRSSPTPVAAENFKDAALLPPPAEAVSEGARLTGPLTGPSRVSVVRSANHESLTVASRASHASVDSTPPSPQSLTRDTASGPIDRDREKATAAVSEAALATAPPFAGDGKSATEGAPEDKANTPESRDAGIRDPGETVTAKTATTATATTATTTAVATTAATSTTVFPIVKPTANAQQQAVKSAIQQQPRAARFDAGTETPELASGPAPKPAGASTSATTSPVAGRLLSSVRSALSLAIGRTFSYPLQARRRHWEGEVLLDVELQPGGQIGRVDIIRSSGYALLDNAAVDSVRSIKRLDHGPLNQSLQLRIPIKYQLTGH